MAIVAKGSMVDGMSGTLGDLVLKRYADKTVAQKRPVFLKNRRSIVQQFRRHHFRKGVRYAKSVLRNPALRAQMEPQVPAGKRLYNYLIKLYCDTHPLIDEVDDNGPVQDVGRFISVPELKRPEAVGVSREYKVSSASSFLMEHAERVKLGEAMFAGRELDDSVVTALLASLK